MKFSIKFYFALLLVSSCLNSCSEDEDGFTPSASDIAITIDENPSSGESIGTVATNLTGTLVYSITSQSAENALTINSSTGELTIDDSSKFNYEENMSIEATVSVTNSEQSATSNIVVTLNDIDDIWFFLSSSRDDYLNAENNSWIMITASEYNALSENLMETTRCGTSEDEFNSSGFFTSGGGNNTWSNDNNKTIPANSYLIAFKVNSWSNNAASSSVKISTGEATGPFMSVGPNLPQHNSGNRYFVYKGSNTTTSSEGYLGYFASVAIGAKSYSNSVFRLGTGNAETLTDVSSGFVILFQGISSTIKQWD